MSYEAVLSHGEDIIRRAAPETVERNRCIAAHSTPGTAIIVEYGAKLSTGIDIRRRTTPDTVQCRVGAAALRAPAVRADRGKNRRGRRQYDGQKIQQQNCADSQALCWLRCAHFLLRLKRVCSVESNARASHLHLDT